MTGLALIRHGHTPWNREGRLQGRTDVSLDIGAIGELAAQRLPAGWIDAELVASPLKRALQTAEIVGTKTPASVPDLIEMDWGHWEGRFGKLLRADPASGYVDIEHWGWDFRPPGGESVVDVRDRVLPWALDRTRNTVAVCHIGIMRVLLACATGWDFKGPAPFAIKRNRLYILTVANDRLSWDGIPVRLEKR